MCRLSGCPPPPRASGAAPAARRRPAAAATPRLRTAPGRLRGEAGADAIQVGGQQVHGHQAPTAESSSSSAWLREPRSIQQGSAPEPVSLRACLRQSTAACSTPALLAQRPPPSSRSTAWASRQALATSVRAGPLQGEARWEGQGLLDRSCSTGNLHFKHFKNNHTQISSQPLCLPTCRLPAAGAAAAAATASRVAGLPCWRQR